MALESQPPIPVTITLLPISLSLIHIPRSRLIQLSHPIIHLLLSQSPTFLNITCNEIEISLFVHHHALKDFEPIARRDRLRAHSRSKSSSSATNNHSNGCSSSAAFEAVETSYEKWNVLQIDSHSEQLGELRYETDACQETKPLISPQTILEREFGSCQHPWQTQAYPSCTSRLI
jgi:hypothetical protein